MIKKPTQTAKKRPTQTRLRIRIPQEYHQQPIISQLAAKHNLEVNILAAILGGNAVGDGWFYLQISGSSEEINNALIYLSDLDIEVWPENTEQDGW